MPELVFSERDNGQRLEVQVGDTIAVRLAENASTGYRWFYDAVDPAIIELSEGKSDYPSPALGSGGTAIFRFRILAAGSAVVGLARRRSWEDPSAAIQRFSLSIDAASTGVRDSRGKDRN